jgi:hypothetical protein
MIVKSIRNMDAKAVNELDFCGNMNLLFVGVLLKG